MFFALENKVERKPYNVIVSATWEGEESERKKGQLVQNANIPTTQFGEETVNRKRLVILRNVTLGNLRWERWTRVRADRRSTLLLIHRRASNDLHWRRIDILLFSV